MPPFDSFTSFTSLRALDSLEGEVACHERASETSESSGEEARGSEKS